MCRVKQSLIPIPIFALYRNHERHGNINLKIIHCFRGLFMVSITFQIIKYTSDHPHNQRDLRMRSALVPSVCKSNAQLLNFRVRRGLQE